MRLPVTSGIFRLENEPVGISGHDLLGLERKGEDGEPTIPELLDANEAKQLVDQKAVVEFVEVLYQRKRSLERRVSKGDSKNIDLVTVANWT